jgi:hypothetical protein
MMQSMTNQANLTSQSTARQNSDENELKDLTTPLPNIAPVPDQASAASLKPPVTTSPQSSAPSGNRLQSASPNNQNQSPSVLNPTADDSQSDRKLLDVSKPLNQAIENLPVGF